MARYPARRRLIIKQHNYMKKFLTLCAMFVVAVLTVHAGPITADAAQQLAQSFLSSQTSGRHASGLATSQQQLTLQATLTDCYVFQRPSGEGFVIVANDDAATQPVLGYSDTGRMDTGSMPCNLRWLLEEYGRELAWAREHTPTTDALAVQVKAATASRTAILPLVQSHWSQDAPYNALCPSDNYGQCVTGCVATAAAQIMRYHQHPAKGTGSHSYTWNNQTLSRDFSQSTYDWENMLLDYGSTYTKAQEQAVARLMVDVGYAFDMEYSSSASGTYSSVVPSALTSYFGYSQTTREVYRSSYGLTAWINLLYNELQNRRPVYISGANDSGGHAFVLDGYKDGYFHINWGWGGVSDGYFLISALDPSTQGIGGSSAGYNSQQDAILGIEPADGSGTPAAAVPTIYLGTFNAYSSSLRRTGNFNFGDMGTNIYNFASSDASGYVGLKVTDQSGQVTYLACEEEASIPGGYGIYGTDVNVPLSGFPTDQTQTYKVSPAFKSSADGKWYDMFIYNSTTNYINATTDANYVYFTTPSASDVTLTATDITLPEKIFAGNSFTVRAHISATGGEYDDKVYAYSGSTQIGYVPVNVDEQTSIDVAFSCTARSATGTFTLTLKDKDGNPLADGISYTVETAPSGSFATSISNVEFIATTPNDLHLKATFNCTSGYYDGQVMAAVFEDGGTSSKGRITSTLTTWAGQQTTVDFQSAFSGTVGQRYFILFVKPNGSSYDYIDYNYYYFTLEENAVNPDPEPEPIVVDEYASIRALIDSAYTAFAKVYGNVTATSRPSLTDVQLNFASDSNTATVLAVLANDDTADGQPTGVRAGSIFVVDQSQRGLMLTWPATVTDISGLSQLEPGNRFSGHLVGSYKETNGLPVFEVTDTIPGSKTAFTLGESLEGDLPVAAIESVGTLASTNEKDAEGQPNVGNILRQAYGPYLNLLVSLPGTVREHDGQYWLLQGETDAFDDAALSRILLTSDEQPTLDLSPYVGVTGTLQGLLLKRNTQEAKVALLSPDFFQASRIRLSETDAQDRLGRLSDAGLLSTDVDVYVHRTALTPGDSAYTTICLPFDLSAEEFRTAFGCDITLLAEATGEVTDDGVHQFRSVASRSIEAGRPYLLRATGTQTAGHATAETDDAYWAHIGQKQLAPVEPTAVSASYDDAVVGGEFSFYGTYGQISDPADGGSQKHQFVSATDGLLHYLTATSSDVFPGLRAYYHFPSWDASAYENDKQDQTDYIIRIAVDGQQVNAINGLTFTEADLDAPVYNLNGQYVGTRSTRLAKGVYVQQGRKFVVK